MQSNKERISIVNQLRGFAAIIVALHHLCLPQFQTIYTPFVNQMMDWGKYGVEIFFVISGFILPYSMDKSGFERTYFFRFLFKRVLRILPLLYISLFLFLLMYWIPVFLHNSRIEGVPEGHYKFDALPYNLTLTVPFFDSMWYNAVYWTLSIEFQFYILLGLAFHLLRSNTINILLIGSALVGCCLKYYNVGDYFFKYASVFNIGIIAYKLQGRTLGVKTSYAHLAFQVAIGYLTLGFLSLVFSLATFFLIVYLKYENKIFNWLGDISFAFYLNHTLAYFCLEAIMKRIINPNGIIIIQFMFGLIYLTGALILGYLMHRYIEKPLLRLFHLTRK